ncbi:MAG: hypothetical protein ACI4WT_06940 [Oligosphaeraceae bacterium]
MAIVVAGIIGGAIVGAVIKGPYSDYSDYSDHSDYSDAAYQEGIRRKAEEEKRLRRLAEAKADLDDAITQNVSQFENQNLLSVDQVATADSCRFEQFEDDIADQNAAVKQAVQSQGAADQARQLKRQQDRLKRLDDAINAISQAIRNQD